MTFDEAVQYVHEKLEEKRNEDIGIVPEVTTKKDKVTYRENGTPIFSIEVQTRDYGEFSLRHVTSVENHAPRGGQLLRSGRVAWRATNNVRGYWDTPFPIYPRGQSGTIVGYDIQEITSAALYDHELAQTFSYSVLRRAQERLTERPGAREKLVISARKQLAEALYRAHALREEHEMLVKILGRRPNVRQMMLAQVMKPAMRELMDTPLVIRPALTQYEQDVLKRRTPHTTLAAIKRASRVTPANITRIGKRFYDPSERLRPRQWRWFMNQRAKTIGTMGSKAIALYADYFPDIKKYKSHVDELVNFLQRYENIPEVTRIILQAIKKHIDSGKEVRDAYADPIEWAFMIRESLRGDTIIPVNGNTKRASLKWLHSQYRQGGGDDPPRSLQHGGPFMIHAPTDEITINDFTFTPLKTHVDLFREGEALRHCLFNGHGAKHKDGSAVSYSVKHEGKHIATAMFTRGTYYSHYNPEDDWRLHDYAGMHNCKPTAGRPEAKELEKRLNA